MTRWRSIGCHYSTDTPWTLASLHGHVSRRHGERYCTRVWGFQDGKSVFAHSADWRLFACGVRWNDPMTRRWPSSIFCDFGPCYLWNTACFYLSLTYRSCWLSSFFCRVVFQHTRQQFSSVLCISMENGLSVPAKGSHKPMFGFTSSSMWLCYLIIIIVDSRDPLIGIV
jgi:hypothetical protein